MKYLFTMILLMAMIYPSIGQDSLTTITKIELHDLGDGQGIVKLFLKSNELDKLESLKIQLTGNRIPRGTVVLTLKGSSTMTNRDKSQNFELEGNVTLTAVDEEKENGISYRVKDDGLNKFRNLEPGTVIYFPPLDKTEN
jgi:hypothetical protein